MKPFNRSVKNLISQPHFNMSEVMNIPILRFSEFQGNWDKKNLSEIGEIVNGITYSPSQVQESGILVLRSSNVQDGRLSFHDNVYISVDKYNPVKLNDILICVRNGSQRLIGKNAIINKEFDNVGFGAFMTIYRSIFNPFLQHWFQSKDFYKNVHKNLGATINSINGSDLKKFKVPFPKNNEQQKIADFLTAVDRRIELLEKKKTLLETYKKGVMKKIFNQEIRFKDDNGNDFPDWEEKRLGEICKLQGGYAFKSNSFKDTGIPIIRISNISNDNNYLNLENLVHYEEISNEENFTVLKGDLLIAMSGATTGKTSISNYDGKCYLNQRVGLFKSKTDKLNYSYLVQFVYSPMFGSQLVRFLVAGAQPNISSKDIESVRIPFPLTIEQQKISQFLSSIDTQLKLIETQIDKSKTWKKGLLQKMFV